MESDNREIAADGQKHDARAVPSEVWIQFERARQNLGAQKRSRTVADNHDLLGVAGALLGVTGARDVDEVLRETVDALVPFRPLTVREFPGPDRVRQQIEQVSGVFR